MIIRTLRNFTIWKMPASERSRSTAGLAVLIAFCMFSVTPAFSADQPTDAAPTAAFAFVESGNVPQGALAFPYRIPRDDKTPWTGNRPWLEITKEAGDWEYAKTFTTVTVVDNPDVFHLMDMYIHGDPISNTPLIKITNIDLRKYFPQPIANKNSCIARVQAYLGVYNRKGRSISTKIDGIHSQSSNVSKVDVINNCREPGNWEFNIHEAVDGKSRKVMHGYFYIPVDYLNPRMKKHTGYAWRDAGVGLRFPRHPLNRSKPNAALPSTKINRIKASAVNFTEERAGGDLAMIWWAMPKFPAYCNINELKKIYSWLPTASDFGKAEAKPNKLTAATGPIDYSTMPSETRAKSGIAKKADGTPIRQTLSYVKTQGCSITGKTFGESRGADRPPEGFRWPFNLEEKDRKGLSISKWKSACAIVPHTFRNWEDVKNYRVRLSGFEGDGTYGCAVKGKTTVEKLTHRKAKLKDDLNCWRFSYDKYISDFTGYRLAQKNGFTELHLINTSKATFLRRGLGRSVIIGFNNDKLNEAGKEGVHFLLGYNSKKLTAPYGAEDVEEYRPHYAFVVDQSGNIKDHYGLSNLFRDGVGIGKVQVQLEGTEDNRKLIVTLISHERIVPLTQFKLDYPDTGETPADTYQDFQVSESPVDREKASADATAELEKRVAAYKPKAGEEIIADAVLNEGMTYHAVIVKTDKGPIIRRYMASGTSSWPEEGLELVERDGRYFEKNNDYAENFRINGSDLEFYDLNGLVARAPITRR